jgi:hypothetical protein
MISLRLLTTYLGRLVYAVVVLLTLTAQSISLAHDHQGEETHSVECAMCLKQGADSDLLLVSLDLPAVSRPAIQPLIPDAARLFAAPQSIRSRSPPSL